MAGTVQRAFAPGVSYIEALLEGFSWTGGTGSPATIGYSFGITYEGGALFNASQQAAAQAAMQLYSNVANLSFSQVSAGSALLTYSAANFAPTLLGLTSTSFSGSGIISSEVQVNTNQGNLALGSEGFLTLLHEVGHALGLKHPGNYSGSETPPFLPSAEDTNDATVMSYNFGAYTGSSFPITPMIYDIAAIQYLYGVNTGYNSGNTTYSVSGAGQSFTIWDGGGTDIIDTGAYSGNATIDLRAGYNNVTVAGNSFFWVAFNANIENGAAGAGNDMINGNSLANQLFGRGGGDTAYGNEGNDTIYGGAGIADPTDGADALYGGGGSDYLIGNGGNDTIYGGAGIFDPGDSADIAYGGGGSDYLIGNGGNDQLFGGGSGVDPNDTGDTIYAGGGADTVYGNGGNDFLYGGGSVADPGDSADLIYAGAGNDQLFGNGGNDTMVGGEGDDTFYGGNGNDIYALGSGSGNDVAAQFDNSGAGDIIQVIVGVNGSSIANAADLLAAVSYVGGNAIVNLGSGNSITILGVSSGLTVDDFSIG